MTCRSPAFLVRAITDARRTGCGEEALLFIQGQVRVAASDSTEVVARFPLVGMGVVT
jgi:hypothetical protein